MLFQKVGCRFYLLHAIFIVIRKRSARRVACYKVCFYTAKRHMIFRRKRVRYPNLCKPERAENRLNELRLLWLLFVVCSEPGIQPRVVIAHNAAIALRSRAEAFKQSLAVCVKESEITAFQLTASFGNHSRIAAGVLHVVESAGR